MKVRLLEKFQTDVMPKLITDFAYRNVMEVPRLSKVCLNMGLGEAVKNPKLIGSALGDLTLIAGQKPVVTRARRSIAGFKLRQGMPIGVSVTLRRDRMFEFLDRLMNVALPRVRDFKGVSPKAFDGRGNYAIGIREQIIFPEIDYDKVDRVTGLAVNIVTTARTDDEAQKLLAYLGMPFRK